MWRRTPTDRPFVSFATLQEKTSPASCPQIIQRSVLQPVMRNVCPFPSPSKQRNSREATAAIGADSPLRHRRHEAAARGELRPRVVQERAGLQPAELLDGPDPPVGTSEVTDADDVERAVRDV